MKKKKMPFNKYDRNNTERYYINNSMRKSREFRERNEEEAGDEGGGKEEDAPAAVKRDDDERDHPLALIVDSTTSLTKNEINSNSVAIQRIRRRRQSTAKI